LSSEYIEYTIKVKNESSTLSEKDISYEPILLSKECDFLSEKVNAVAQRFFASISDEDKQESPEIVISLKMVWQS
jgi:hypothetical protein